MTPKEKIEIRREVLDYIITGYDQLIDLFTTGGQAPLTGHAYDPKEKENEVKLLNQLKQGLIEMRDSESIQSEG
jgi:hypothetical protein